MALRVQVLVAATLVLAVWGAEVEDYTGKFAANVETFLSDFNETIHIPVIPMLEINIPGILILKVNLWNTSITGIKDISGTEFTYDPDTHIVKATLHEPSLEIYVEHLKMEGVLFGNINIDGIGDGWFWLENCDMTIEGPTVEFNFDGSEPIANFTDVKLTLDLQQWTVDIRGVTPDSDLTQMMNSFFTMLGPEIFHALGDVISAQPKFLDFVNRVFQDPAGIDEVPLEEQSETAEEQVGSAEEQYKVIKDASVVVSNAHADLIHQKSKLEHRLSLPRLLESWDKY